MKKFITILLIFAIIHIPTAYVYCYEDDIPPYARREEENIKGSTILFSSEETKKYEEIPVHLFRISNISPNIQTDFDYTDLEYNEWEDCHYIYLPSTADRNNLTITYSADSDIYLNNVKVISGQTTSLLSESNEFDITISGISYGKLKIMQSNLGCIYLSTQSGGLNALDSNGNLTETGSALMLNKNGGIEYSGNIEKITSHGNSSWWYSKKKPYNFKLPAKANLYGMGKAKKWMLISNYLDHSMLRNYFTMELSRMAGFEYVIDSTFVDLYADGSYRGTYQLCERIQIQKTRLNIFDLEEETEKLNAKPLEEYSHIAVNAANVSDCKTNSYKYYDIPNEPSDITGGYLLQFQQWNRYGYKADSGFVTSRGQAVQIDGPEKATKSQVLYIRKFMQELEDAIYSDTGYNSLGKHYSEYMDVDSLAAAYIIEELAMNIDSGTTSFYMWKDSDISGDGKLHFSPMWDYDLAYGVFAKSAKNSVGDYGWSLNTNNLFAAYFPINGYAPENTKESGMPTEGINYLGKMYKKDEYKKIVAKVWTEKFKPVLINMLTSEKPELTDIAEKILPSAEMNNAKWHTYGGKAYCVFGDRSGKDFMESVEMLREFAEKRMNYLSKVWGDIYNRDIFEQFKQSAKKTADEQSEISDSAACAELIEKAKAAVDLCIYDANISIENNKSEVDAIIKNLIKELEKQREYDRLPQYICGDVDCDKLVTKKDAALILRKTIETETILPIQREKDDWIIYADLDHDNSITVNDAVLIFQKIT